MKRARILSASAGSGKTYQLALKYICDIVRHPEKFRNILAVTFTNKATEEMKSRILREIDALASNSNSSYLAKVADHTGYSHAKIRSQALKARTLILHDYSRFSVLTIDKFFQRVIRAFIKELGIDLNYNIELDTATLLQRSADDLVESIATNKELRHWMLEYAEERMNDGERWDMRGELRNMGSEIFKESATQRMSQKISKSDLYDIVARMAQQSSACKNQIKGIAADAVKYLEDRGIAASRFKGSSRSFVQHFWKYASGELQAPNQTLLRASEDIEQWYGKNPDAEIVAAAEYLQPKLRKICELYTNNISMINTAKILHENYRSYALLGDLYDKVKDICGKENIMILSETKNILSTFVDDNNTPFIYEKIGNRYDYFMIDEFQDTSLREWLNLRPLLLNAMASNPDTSVFIVGDVKQSIYRWRGGDWRLLNSKAADDLGYESVELVSLKENYRSQSNIVEFNNSLIESVVNEDNEYINTKIGNALNNNKISDSLHKSLNNIIKTAYTDHKQRVGGNMSPGGYSQVYAFDPKYCDSPFIQAIEDAISRGYRYRDILILVRGATDGRKVADVLFAYKEQKFTSQGKAGFNILTPDALTIERCDITEFIIAVMRLSIDPANDVERGVYNRYLGYEFTHKFDEDELAALQRIAHLSPMEAFEQIVKQFELNKCKESIAFLQAMHEQVISFSTTRLSDIHHYLDWWEERGRYETIRVEMTDDTIEVTTIHKSKGLEAPIVIIPYCKWDLIPKSSIRPIVWAKADEKSVETFSIGEFPVVYNNTMEQSAFTEEYYNELVMSHVDGINLLYVAITRASKELYMYVPYSLNSKSSSDNITSVAPLIINAAKSIAHSSKIEESLEGISGIEYSFGTREREVVADGDKAIVSNILLDEYVSHQPEISVRYPGKRFDKEEFSVNKSRGYGILLHRVFEKARTLNDLHRALHDLDMGCNIDETEKESLLQNINNSLEIDVVKHWFSYEWDDVKCEADIITSDTMRRPDRVMIDGRNATIVDYKFGDIERSNHLKQVREYMSLLEAMGKYDNIEGYVWYITLGKVIKV
ncbi:MAG: UvrD-helicase domain-containing protein [Alistipes sp.]|nr:UvrD-helicase domain-containing protein [Alistipes sp.]